MCGASSNERVELRMLWLAGVMGLMAVGAVTFVEIETPPEEEMPEGDIPHGGPGTVGDILSGSDDSETVQGGTGDDQLGGYGGNDLLHGAAGDDDLHGHDGDDTLRGDDGDDSLHGNDGDDDLFGGAGNDSLFGHNGDDFLFGGAGNDALQGSAGDDVLNGEAGSDALQGGLGDDALRGGAGEDTLFGGWGDDTLTGADDLQSRDYLNGGGGDDLIVAGAGDVVTSGEGTDQIALGDWIGQGGAAQITDYHAEDDSLLFVWDDSSATGAEPPLSILPDPDDAGQTLVLLDDIIVARVVGDSVTMDDIALIPLSAAFDLGLAA
ncbi:MAG: calcium-binding protein [Sulfitobacter sp.]|uniref:calcium-binding protein n=2 Tax=Sulfitobacter sp. TaxID=1903071 RepID=UPI003299D221